ncbi:MAG: carbon storage regulator [Planctomycetota bacterium]|nr:MAG: carbon storage regulator [Planctomycetota bacterium]REJ93663.1 MAG: carbon storage regulator [Planctomycetota bacterium]REK25712.1 MAG: carbon storage regulator [Planctomycetota bacterium]REK46542.1 MAG: carbon storage regulator [Planctomycetota bacterium]
MLVLSRQVGEQIKIGENIVVIVSRIAGNRVMLAVDAPRDVHIVRGELKPLPPEERGRSGKKRKEDKPISVPVAPAIDVENRIDITSQGVSYLTRRAR